MNIRFDEESDVIYIRLDDSKKITDSEEVQSGIVLDFDDKGGVIGIEILGVKKHIPLDQLKKFNLEVA
ncbi:MAG: DUF2283 domain-containing protein [Halobacteriovoraceae bacterium]|nr:DUF2283 domain-containing protein [Halobacteriovoraceae bacterium]